MKNKIWTIISIVIVVLQLAAEAFLAYAILRLNMLPAVLVALLIVVLLLPLLLTAGLLFLKIKGTEVGLVRRIIAIVVALLVICVCGLAAKPAIEAYNTIHTVTNTAPPTNAQSMYVLVRTDDPAQSLVDAAGYTFAVIEQYDQKNIEGTLEYIEAAVGKTIAVTEYASATEVADALFAEQVDAVIFNSVSIALLEETENYEDFTDRARVLQEIPLSELNLPEEETVPPETKPVIQSITNTPFVVYVSGTDTRSSITSISRSDVNILMVVNPVTKQVLLINTPRDYYVPNPAGGGSMDKLTHLGLYGVDCTMTALGNMYGLPVNYYGRINFTGFETLVDAIGGITVYSDEAFSVAEYSFHQGENYLTGEAALHFARDRYHVSGGDQGRGKNQMKVIKAVIEKLTSRTTIISNYSEILLSMEGMFSTSITMDEISNLVRMQLTDMAKWNIQTIAVSGAGGSARTYSMPGSYAYVMYPDEDQVAYVSQLAQRVLDGEILTEEDLAFPE